MARPAAWRTTRLVRARPGDSRSRADHRAASHCQPGASSLLPAPQRRPRSAALHVDAVTAVCSPSVYQRRHRRRSRAVSRDPLLPPSRQQRTASRRQSPRSPQILSPPCAPPSCHRARCAGATVGGGSTAATYRHDSSVIQSAAPQTGADSPRRQGAAPSDHTTTGLRPSSPVHSTLQIREPGPKRSASSNCVAPGWHG